jgi:hypothetical protein
MPHLAKEELNPASAWHPIGAPLVMKFKPKKKVGNKAHPDVLISRVQPLI